MTRLGSRTFSVLAQSYGAGSVTSVAGSCGLRIFYLGATAPDHPETQDSHRSEKGRLCKPSSYLLPPAGRLSNKLSEALENDLDHGHQILAVSCP
jgi:hypothetical protein